MQKLQWGILGTGNIANQFCRDVRAAERCELAAVGSRDAVRAAAFAAKYDIPRAHGSYDALLADADVDAIYVSLPNAMHHVWTIKSLRAGKHVLCEKPLASNARQAREMFDCARDNQRVLVEAFMYHSHPLTHSYLEKIRNGEIGEIKLIRASFCFRTLHIEGNTRFDPDQQGGALMDVGCYCIDFAQLVAGRPPIEVHGYRHQHETGVDDYAAALLRFDNDLLATFTTALTVQADNTVSVCGTDGYIEIPIPWKPPSVGAIYRIGRSIPPRMDRVKAIAQGKKPSPPKPVEIKVDAGKPLYALEADDFAATVLDGAPPAVSEQMTLATMGVLDELRTKS